MKINISNIISIQDYDKKTLDFCKKELTFKNSEYEKSKRLGFSYYHIPKTIKLYNEYDNVLYVPYGFFNRLFAFYPHIEDYTDYTTIKKRKIESNITLRDYQELGLQAVVNEINGVLILPTGLGKTELALECAYKLGQHFLWITHTSDLVNQAKDRCESKMKCTTSTITEGKCDLSGTGVFATVQTLVKAIENGKIKQDEFGMIIVDECHRISTNPSSFQMFRTCVEYFSARYKIGVTATLHRADGLADCITRILGDVIYKIEKKGDDYCSIYHDKILLRFPVDKFQVPCKIIARETNYDITDKNVFSPKNGTLVFATLITSIATDEERNKMIITDLLQITGSTLVLSDRVDQLKYLCNNVPNGVQIDGVTSKKVRTKALDDMRSGEKKYLFASYSLAKEGLDVPILSNLVLATPVKDFAIVIQSLGRIQRPYKDKKIAIVYDYVDNVGMLLGFYSKRRSIYRKNNWDIENVYLGDGKND